MHSHMQLIDSLGASIVTENTETEVRHDTVAPLMALLAPLMAPAAVSVCQKAGSERSSMLKALYLTDVLFASYRH